MRAIAIFSFLLVAFFLVLFFIANTLGLGFEETVEWMKTEGAVWAALIGIFLLVTDFFLPVPSSLVMIYNGMLFGPIWGAALSLIGGLGASFTGYYAGRSGKKYLLRFIPKTEIERSERFFSKWGLPVIAITRPVPLLSEAGSVVAGMSGVSKKNMLGYSLLGLVPSSIIYAITGAYALDIEGGIISFTIVIGISAIGWGISYSFQKKLENKTLATK